ncbi:type II toxin-antitoxin system RelE/ParE family toxin [Candidatus Dependentiae bacterium]
MIKKFLAHKGSKFAIEWYFNKQGKSTAFEYFKKLSPSRKKKLIHLLFVLGDVGKMFNKEKFRYEGDQIYAIKTSPDRFLCFFFEGAKIIITNAYEKKSAKMPKREKLKSLNAKKGYKERCNGGVYYE